MNEELRDKLAREYPDKHHPEVNLEEARSWPDWAVMLEMGIRARVRDADFNAYRAGWNACFAEMSTKRTDPEPDWYGKEQTRD